MRPDEQKNQSAYDKTYKNIENDLVDAWKKKNGITDPLSFEAFKEQVTKEINKDTQEKSPDDENGNPDKVSPPEDNSKNGKKGEKSLFQRFVDFVKEFFKSDWEKLNDKEKQVLADGFKKADELSASPVGGKRDPKKLMNAARQEVVLKSINDSGLTLPEQNNVTKLVDKYFKKLK